MKFRTLIFVSLLALSNSSLAELLTFPVGKNGIKIFPQRFEYQLIDKDHFRLGDIMIDFTKVDFQMIPANKKQTEFKVRFHWPASLVPDGRLMITDNSGKSLLDEKISFDDIHNDEDPHSLDPGFRSQVSYLDTPVISEDLWEKLRFTAFFKLCVMKSDESTKIYLCSKDLFVLRNADGISIRGRDSLRSDSFVEINGRPVDPQGALFLNSRKDTISLKAVLASGASVEIFTRMKEVNFKDISTTEDGEKIVIRAAGTEPVNPELVRHLGNRDWEMELPKNRPTMFLQGEGAIPLRQEFLITGKLRKENIKVNVLSGWQESTYSSSLDLNLEKPSEEIHLQPANKLSTLDENYRWTLLQLEKGKANDRDLEVETPEGKFIASHRITRGYAGDFAAHLAYPLLVDFNLKYQLPGMRFGTLASYSKGITKTSSSYTWNSFDVGISLRKDKGLYMVDPSLGLSLISRSLLGDANTNQTIISLWSEKKTPEWMPGNFGWWINKLLVPVSTTSSDYTLKTGYQFDSILRKFKGPQRYSEIGFQLANLSLEPNATSSASAIDINKAYFYLGMGILF